VIWGNEMTKGQGHTPWPTPLVTVGSAGGKTAERLVELPGSVPANVPP
jgi:hypothetical protein